MCVYFFFQVSVSSYGWICCRQVRNSKLILIARLVLIKTGCGSSVIATARNPEVVNPGEFSNVHPVQGQPLVKFLDPDKVSLPISHLSQVTHDITALEIGKDVVFYTFLSKQKVGKALELVVLLLGRLSREYRKANTNGFLNLLLSFQAISPGGE